jgi:hypothetical protein
MPIWQRGRGGVNPRQSSMGGMLKGSQPRTRGDIVGGSLAARDVTVARHVANTNHAVAAPIWAVTQSTGMAWENGGNTTEPRFLFPFYATGRPIADRSATQS